MCEQPDKKEEEYATLSWRVGDLDQFEASNNDKARWLSANEKYLRDVLCERGNEFIDATCDLPRKPEGDAMNSRYEILSRAVIDGIRHALFKGAEWTDEVAQEFNDSTHILPYGEAGYYRTVARVLAAVPCLHCTGLCRGNEHIHIPVDEDGMVDLRHHKAEEDDDADASGVAVVLDPLPGTKADIILTTDEQLLDAFGLEGLCDLLDALHPLPDDDEHLDKLGRYLAFGPKGENV